MPSYHITQRRKKFRFSWAYTGICSPIRYPPFVVLPQGQWIHFDIEDNPLTETGQKHVYLWGFLIPAESSETGQELFEYDWTDHGDDVTATLRLEQWLRATFTG